MEGEHESLLENRNTNKPLDIQTTLFQRPSNAHNLKIRLNERPFVYQEKGCSSFK